MNALTDGQYVITRQKNILTANLTGPFTEEVAKYYENDIKEHVEQLKNSPWASLIIFKGNGIFSPEAEQTLTDVTHYRVKNNMVAIATVFLNPKNADIQQMQLTRIYQTCRVAFNMFSNVDVAQAWLQSLLQEKNQKTG